MTADDAHVRPPTGGRRADGSPHDPFAPSVALRATGLLGAFNAAEVLVSADVHVARRLGALTRTGDEAVLLAAALAVRAPRLGHVYVDLAEVAATASAESDAGADLSLLPWPAPDAWLAAVAASPLGAGDAPRPLRLDGSHLYLDRSWREEEQLATDLRALAAGTEPAADPAAVAPVLARLFPTATQDGLPELAVAGAALRRLSVVAGGPGTGKTTTVGLLVAGLLELAADLGQPPPLVALAAPTGKAAARLEEALHEQAAKLDGVRPATREALLGLSASTLHRLLGWRPDAHNRFRHERGNRLPHDVVVVDESSMVSLALMGRLVEAVRPGARLVLVGDPGQLTSVEAGAVLGDVVGPARDGLVLRPQARAALEQATGRALPAAPVAMPAAVTAGGGARPAAGAPTPAGATADDRAAPAAGGAARGIGDGIVVLREVHRFRGVLAELARAVEAGDAAAALALLTGGDPAVRWLDVDVAEPAADLGRVRQEAVQAGRAVHRAAVAGEAREALTALGAFRILCAHRRGPYGAARWQQEAERWLAEAVPGFAAHRDPGYPGRPLLVTENDDGLGLFNGDTGVVVRTAPDHVAAAFERRGEVVLLAPGRLQAVETAHAMTVHKSQGSQFTGVAVLLPGPDSPILTRELLYTAITRAQERLLVAGTEASLRRAIARPVARATGLGPRLWSTA